VRFSKRVLATTEPKFAEQLDPDLRYNAACSAARAAAGQSEGAANLDDT
jgi:hypothetical protein